jgi:hypothetical protein
MRRRRHWLHEALWPALEAGGGVGIELIGLIRARRGQHAQTFVSPGAVLAEKLLRTEPLLLNQRRSFEMAREDLTGIVEHRLA